MIEDWISAKVAWDMVSPRYSHAQEAEIAIFRYAKEKEILAKVRRLTFIAHGKKVEHHDIDVPLAFWDSMLLSKLGEDFLEMPLSLRYKDWILGDFSISVNKIPYELRGVCFDRSGVKNMLAAGAPLIGLPQSSTRAQRGRPRLLDHAAIRESARVLLTKNPDISIASAAASIVTELPRNPKTGKQYDQRGIERKIASLWGGD